MFSSAPQLSESLGVQVQVGVVTCGEDPAAAPEAVAEERCVGGCWVGLADDFTVVEADSTAVVGPRVAVRGSCGCPDPTTTATPARARPCTPETCLNGGRCLSTSSETR